MADIDLKVPLRRFVGSVGPDWLLEVRDGDGVLRDISAWTVVGASFIMREHESGAVIVGGGAVSVVTTTSQLKYTFVAADVVTAGIYDVYFTVTNEEADEETVIDLRPLQIDTLPS